MGDLIPGDDGLVAEKVGVWAKEKQKYLCDYIEISRATRAKYLAPAGNGGACYIDLFCGPGRSFIKDTGEWIDGSPVAAWKKSVDAGSPFSRVIIADIDSVRLEAATERLRRLGAPVEAILGPASETSFKALQKAPSFGLNFAFLDPFSIGVLEFDILRTLARIRRVDILVHLSKMDLQRNLPAAIIAEQSQFDAFAPGWRKLIRADENHASVRRRVFEYWRELVAGLGVEPSSDAKLITGSRGQHLYWLLIAARHELAHKFWKESTRSNQSDFGF